MFAELEYVVLDASHYPVEELRPVENVVSGVFLMEQAESLAELDDLLEELEEITDDSGLEEDIALLVSSVAGKLTRTGKKVPRMRTFQEVKNMLLERAERWPKQWEEKGRKKGRKEGMEKGRRKGKVELLRTQANHRFGELPRSAIKRFNRADVDTLDRWSRQLLDAKRSKSLHPRKIRVRSVSSFV